MRTWLLSSLIVAQMSTPLACDGTKPPAVPPGELTDLFTTFDGLRLGVQTLVTGLEIPWSLAFAPDGRLFITERPGRVRVYQDGQLLAQPALVLDDVRAVGEGGAMGIAIHPRFAVTRYVYLLYTANTPGGPVNRLVRYREVNGTLGDRAVLLERLTAASTHNGGRIRFGPDDRLYLTMGDAANTALPQSLSSLNGKILRLDDDGRAVSDNPFAGEIWTWGHRNPQGIDWHPATRQLWGSEHGPTGNDEINRLDRGKNYGWPVIQGAETRPDMEAPVAFYSPSIAPSGASFYSGALLPGVRQNLFIATLAGRHIHRVVLDAADATRISRTERWLEGRFGRIRDVVVGPDGAIYFCTNNRDGRGTPVATDDRVARIVPQ
jgi:glucose/arabinose dehydrogenase